MRTLLYLLLTVLAAACQGGNDEDGVEGGTGGAGAGSFSFTQIGPKGGFFTAVAFHPTSAGTVWASGDDSAGLYKSTDGGRTWAGVATGAVNQSTYSLRIDPNNPNRIYAPNHFGRGMLRSTDSGHTWMSSQAGLPISGTSSQKIHDLAINPTNPNELYVASENGLYRSTNAGASFSLVSLGGSAAVSAVGFRQDGVLFIGKKDGTFGYYAGGVWMQVLGASGIPISVITFSQTSLYLVYVTATIYRMDKNTLAATMINDPSSGGAIRNSNFISLAVVSGASGVSDTIYVATMGQTTVPASKWGVFKSTNGGGNWTQLRTGNYGAIAVDPQNSNHVIAASFDGDGFYYSNNAGATWAQASTTNLYATGSSSLAQDPSNSSHLLTSVTACGGWGASWETHDGGNSWTRFADPVADDGVFDFDMSPTNSNHVLAGTCTQGIYRSTSGPNGVWTQVTGTASQRVDRFVREVGSLIYAVVPTGDANHSLYVSSNGGAGFSPRNGLIAINVAAHPTQAGAGLVVNFNDVFSTTNGFTSVQPLGLSSYAPTELAFSAAAYNPNNPQEIVVGGAVGGLYRTTNGGANWSKLNSPISPSGVRDVVIVNRKGRTVYYAIAGAGDVGVKANSTNGVFRSLDGINWSLISSSLFPSNIPWTMVPDQTSPTTSFLVGMWFGGFYRLIDTE